MKSKLLLLSAAIGALTLSGCATIVGDRDEVITLNSNPSNANITITDEKGMRIHTATTPSTVHLAKADGSYFGGKTYTVDISKEGYYSRHITIDSHVNGWYIGGNLVFGGIIGYLIVDPFTGAMYNLSPDNINAHLDESVASAEDGGKQLNIVLLEDVPKSMRDDLVPVGNA